MFCPGEKGAVEYILKLEVLLEKFSLTKTQLIASSLKVTHLDLVSAGLALFFLVKSALFIII